MSKGNRLRNSRGARTAAQLPGARKGQGRVGTEPLTQKSAGFPSKVGGPVRGGGQAGDPVREGPGPGSLAGGSRVLVAHGDRPRGPLVDAGGTALPSATSTYLVPLDPRLGVHASHQEGREVGQGPEGLSGGFPVWAPRRARPGCPWPRACRGAEVTRHVLCRERAGASCGCRPALAGRMPGLSGYPPETTLQPSRARTGLLSRAAGEGRFSRGVFFAVTPLAHTVPSVESCVLSAHTGVLIILYFFFFFFGNCRIIKYFNFKVSNFLLHT